MKKCVDTSLMDWINKPNNYIIGKSKVIMETKPFTNFWGKTYYHHTQSNGSALVLDIKQNFSFSVRVDYDYKNQFDQSGMLLYASSDNWVKIYTEDIDDECISVSCSVCIHGYCDTSSMRMGKAIKYIYFRIDHLDEDFRVLYSLNKRKYKTMRIFHLKNRTGKFKVGIYAASPKDSSFDVVFSEMIISDCEWKAYNKENYE
ncbi:MAG: DUF1349 domain-containing protein [Firmicutes bacterium]|nr:DUF1349 domain-containing protein [Erysipelotrichaceae bacterium]MDD6525579.1 DUF1349 domain-containing protein [Bacillota bacterium]MDD7227041.1 DUF1349 domain-containing protein [Bacillota bacterium]MDY4972026.1 DUF1349 domain-containing protein [Erysipelotrichaceae bacterium]